MKTKAKAIGAALAVLAALGALFAASASASPAWKFNETSLSGKEVILGGGL